MVKVCKLAFPCLARGKKQRGEMNEQIRETKLAIFYCRCSPGRPSYAARSCLYRGSWWPRSPRSPRPWRTWPSRRCPLPASARARISPPSSVPPIPSLRRGSCPSATTPTKLRFPGGANPPRSSPSRTRGFGCWARRRVAGGSGRTAGTGNGVLRSIERPFIP